MGGTLEHYTGYTPEDLEALSTFECVRCDKVLEGGWDHVELREGDVCLECLNG